MALYQIEKQAGHVDLDNDQEEPDRFVIMKDGAPYHAEDYLEHAVRFVLDDLKEGDRLLVDVLL